MARLNLPKIPKPQGALSVLAHAGLNLLLPAIIYVLVRIDFIQLAIVLVILSKWRMFAVRMRYWPANVRANAVDIMVGISAVIFIAASGAWFWQIIWAALYSLWLIFVKPRSSTLFTSLQAGIAQLVTLMALFMAWGDQPTFLLVLTAWLICYLCARHFFTSFDEPYTSLYSHTWGYFAGGMVWVLAHWLLFYGRIAQPTLLLSVLGYGLAVLYYLDQDSRLTSSLRRQFILMMVAVVVVVLAFSDWGDRAL